MLGLVSCNTESYMGYMWQKYMGIRKCIFLTFTIHQGLHIVHADDIELNSQEKD